MVVGGVDFVFGDFGDWVGYDFCVWLVECVVVGVGYCDLFAVECVVWGEFCV